MSIYFYRDAGDNIWITHKKQNKENRRINQFISNVKENVTQIQSNSKRCFKNKIFSSSFKKSVIKKIIDKCLLQWAVWPIGFSHRHAVAILIKNNMKYAKGKVDKASFSKK